MSESIWTIPFCVVSATQAKLYINGADQPSLVVNDLKLGKVRGKVAFGQDATRMDTFQSANVLTASFARGKGRE
jgi:hypothetical protein